MKVPSRAELGHFNFRAETELDFFDISNNKVFGTQKNESDKIVDKHHVVGNNLT